MSKYDCTLALDYAHERDRMCATMDNECENCPFWIFNCDDITKDQINILQEWSDSHPEMPRITIEEQNFLEAFKDDLYIIARLGDRLTLSGWAHGGSLDLYNNMFPFITSDRYWTIRELLKLEVEE